MFEIDKMEQDFDYSLVDNETADFLRSCEYEMNGIAEDARLKFGGVLERAQKRLASHDNNKGVFQEWVLSGGISLDDAYYYINLNRSSRNLDNQQRNNFLNAPKTLQKEVMKKNAPEELKQQVYDGDISTNKEYQEMKRKLVEVEQAKQQAESQAEQARQSEEIALKQLEELESKEPEVRVVEKEVIKEVDKTDYAKIQKLERQIEAMKLNGQDIEAKEKEVKLLHLEANKSVLSTKIRINELLKDVAFTSYRRGALAASSDATKRDLEEGLNDLENFIKEMRSALNDTITQ